MMSKKALHEWRHDRRGPAVLCLIAAFAPSLLAQTAGAGALTGTVTAVPVALIGNALITAVSARPDQANAPAVALGGGLVSHNERLLDTGRDAVEAEILPAGIPTPLLKYAVGRVRPSDGSDADEFKPFSGNSSFPSGHATEAFAVASVLSARADGWVVPVVSYTLASCVGYARVHDRAHWASDVIAGGLVGTLIGRTIVRRHEGGEAHPETPPAAYSFRIAPVVSSAGLGFTASAAF